MTALLVVVAVGAGSYLLRVSMLVVAARFGLPPIVERAARFAVPVSFTALAATALSQEIGLSRTAIAPAASVLVAVVAVGRTGKPLAAIVAGMPTLWIVTALVA